MRADLAGVEDIESVFNQFVSTSLKFYFNLYSMRDEMRYL